MIKFFRKIRYNLMETGKTGKYFKYAIGEILLVVIGILIALQVNIWNENRKFKNNERELLENMLQNLKTDSIYGSEVLITNRRINSLHLQLYQIGVKRVKDVHIKNPNDVRRMAIFQPITKKNDPFIIDKIKNELIRTEVVSYFSDLDKTDKFMDQLRNVMFDGMRAYLREKKQHDLSALFEDKNKSLTQENNFNDFIREENLIALSKEPEFQQLLFELNIKLTEYSWTLNNALLQNEKLKETISKELKSNY